MKTSSRPREIGGSFASRRGHGTQLSISDTNHHVTEAIGDMYGDDDYSKRDSRPLSFVNSSLHEPNDAADGYFNSNKGVVKRPSLRINGNPSRQSPGIMQSPKSNSFEQGSLSPSRSLREHAADAANSQFPLNNIDYESDPAAVAQELSNLQALRRMSMDVGNTSDPDLPSFPGASFMPSVAPTGDDDEDDPSRLFWVPARVHPELAPMEFKTFLESRVQSIKRRSGDQTGLSPDGAEQLRSSGSLRRKKSMLSRQIDNDGGRGAMGYRDGAEQIERKKSLSQPGLDLKIADLQELDALVKDPSKAMRKLTLETNNRPSVDVEGLENEDMPILPQAPGIGLRRSTRTTYRRGSLRKGERVPFSKRAGVLRGEADGEESSASSPLDVPPGASTIGAPLTRGQSEPATAENFSRPNRGARRLQNIPQAVPTASPETVRERPVERTELSTARRGSEEDASLPQPGALPRSSTFPKQDTPVPQIIETPPPDEEDEQPAPKQVSPFPERSSSQKGNVPLAQKIASPVDQSSRSNRRPNLDRQHSGAPSKASNISQSLNDMAQHPSPLPGSNARTDALTFIPTLDEKKPEKKSKKEKEDENSGSRKPSWGWFKGSDEKDKKDKRKEDDHKESKKAKKTSMEKPHDNARLDVLQSTLDTGNSRGRESLLLDRDTVVVDSKLQDERRKESSRKSGGEKKEKDSLFSSFFGGKKKNDRDSGGKKGSSLRTLSPDPPHRQLKPDVDYNWTRYSLLEERAIYRMAHIKLANPRRALYSQVLLSNFMYSYLAKVQQMHPQMQVPQSAIQKKQEAERRAKEQEQKTQEQQSHNGDQQYRYDYHQGISQYAEPEPATAPEGVNYVDDSQIYEDNHQDGDSYSHRQGSNRPQSRAAQHNADNSYSNQDQYSRRAGNEYYQYGRSEQAEHDHHGNDDDMW